jgi:hypothetical protein
MTIPQIDALVISGSGAIVSEGKIESRILDLTVSGSGDIKLSELQGDKGFGYYIGFREYSPLW